LSIFVSDDLSIPAIRAISARVSELSRSFAFIASDTNPLWVSAINFAAATSFGSISILKNVIYLALYKFWFIQIENLAIATA